MTSTTFDELNARIQLLETYVGQPSKSRNDSINSQLSDIKNNLAAIYKDHTELKTLNRIISDLKLWNDMTYVPEFADTLKNDENNDVSSEIKQELLLLKYPVILEAYNNISQLANMDIPQLINNIESALDETYDLHRNREQILLRKQQLQELTQEYHKMIVKNIVVFEKYTNLMKRENEFWLLASNKVLEMNRKVTALEKKATLDKKY
jgi:23S rRNA U2552 (ribose-2'-O)-methylase RlmE/FtsJ